MSNPFYKASRQTWYVAVSGKQVNLGRDRDAAFAKWATMQSSTASEAIQRFLSLRRNAGTQKFYESHLKLLPVAGLRLDEVKAFHLTDLLEKHDGCYARNIARAAKTCFSWLVETGRIDHSPFEKVKTPPGRHRGEEAYLTPTQIDAVLAKADDDLRDILTFIRETGCRPKEARSIESRHLQNGCVIFPADESKGGIPRVIHLTEAAEAILKTKTGPGPLFTRKGEPWTAKRLATRCKSIGLVCYTLRHSKATELILKGVDILTIATLLGHTNLSQLSKVYSHLSKQDSHLREALQRATA